MSFMLTKNIVLSKQAVIDIQIQKTDSSKPFSRLIFFEKKIHYCIIAFIIILEVIPDFCEIKNL